MRAVRRVRDIVHDVMMAQSKVGMLKKVVAGLSVVIILTLIAMFGVSLAAGIALKDTKLGGEVGTYNKAMLSTDGSPISVDVTETDLDLFERCRILRHHTTITRRTGRHLLKDDSHIKQLIAQGLDRGLGEEIRHRRHRHRRQTRRHHD